MATRYIPPPIHADVVSQQGGKWMLTPEWLKWFVGQADLLRNCQQPASVVPTTTVFATITTVPKTVFTFDSTIPYAYLMTITDVDNLQPTYFVFSAVAVLAGTATLYSLIGGGGINASIVGLNLKVSIAAGPPVGAAISLTRIGY